MKAKFIYFDVRCDYSLMSWKHEWNKMSVPKGYITLHQWCKKHSFYPSYAHRTIQYGVPFEVKYIIILGKKICIIPDTIVPDQFRAGRFSYLIPKGYITLHQWSLKNHLILSICRKYVPLIEHAKLIKQTNNYKQWYVPEDLYYFRYVDITLDYLKRISGKKHLTLMDYAAKLHLSRQRIHQLVLDGRLKGEKIMGRWFVPEDSVVVAVKQGRPKK